VCGGRGGCERVCAVEGVVVSACVRWKGWLCVCVVEGVVVSVCVRWMGWLSVYECAVEGVVVSACVRWKSLRGQKPRVEQKGKSSLD